VTILCSALLPSGPQVEMHDTASGLRGVSSVSPTRIRTTGSDISDQITAWAEKTVVVPAGAPGTITVDLSAMKDLVMQLLVGVAGKIVRIDTEFLAGTLGDLRHRRSAANPVILMSAATDTFAIYGDVNLVNVKPSTALVISAAPTFSATAKNMDFESITGCTFILKVGVC
jgi:hypothetical protein